MSADDFGDYGMDETRPGSFDGRRRNSDQSVRITREIPLPWLIGIVVGLLVQAVTVWIGVQAQGKALDALTVEIKELRATAAQGGLKTVEHELGLKDHERRIQTLERIAGSKP